MQKRPESFGRDASCERIFRWLQQSVSSQVFGDLHGIEGGAFEELVADDPESEAVLQSAILAEAADGAIVLAGEVERHRVALEFRLIDDL